MCKLLFNCIDYGNVSFGKTTFSIGMGVGVYGLLPQLDWLG